MRRDFFQEHKVFLTKTCGCVQFVVVMFHNITVLFVYFFLSNKCSLVDHKTILLKTSKKSFSLKPPVLNAELIDNF